MFVYDLNSSEASHSLASMDVFFVICIIDESVQSPGGFVMQPARIGFVICS